MIWQHMNDFGGSVRRDKIGIATSFFKENDFDPIKTVEFALAHGISIVQLYLNPQLEFDSAQLEMLHALFEENQLTMLVHSPHYLNKAVLDGHHTAALSKLFPVRQKRYVVVHFDEKCSMQEALKTAEDLNRAGFSVALENYYQGRTEKELLENINNYVTLIRLASERKIDLVPVIDFPRLFIEHFSGCAPAFLTKLLLHGISLSTRDIILHMIDTKDAKLRREDWVPIGQGIIPYSDIFEMLDEYRFNVHSAILEFEEASLGEKSLSYFQD